MATKKHSKAAKAVNTAPDRSVIAQNSLAAIEEYLDMALDEVRGLRHWVGTKYRLRGKGGAA